MGSIPGRGGKRLLIVVNIDWFFLSHRLQIAQEAKKIGYEVHIATTITNRSEELKSHGFIVHGYKWRREKFSFLNEATIFINLLLLFYRVRPDIIHLVTIKPILYGGIAAHFFTSSRLVIAISGLGSIYSDLRFIGLLRKWVVGLLYRVALFHSRIKIIFQNIEDKNKLAAIASLDSKKCEIIWGSGVDLSIFQERAIPVSEFVVLMASRLILEKGVWTYIDAVRLLKQRGLNCRYILAGDIDPGNPNSLNDEDIKKIRRENMVEVLGHISDVHNLMSMASIVVLPSFYGEGLPKVLIEAAASGRAIITTDIPGCRDAIVANQTGLLVEPKNPSDLASAIQLLFNDQGMAWRMGEAGRRLAEQKFDIKVVVRRHMTIYSDLMRE